MHLFLHLLIYLLTLIICIYIYKCIFRSDRRGYREHPRTPDPLVKRSKRCFEGILKDWRIQLHRWDVPSEGGGGAKGGADVSAAAASGDSKNDKASGGVAGESELEYVSDTEDRTGSAAVKKDLLSAGQQSEKGDGDNDGSGADDDNNNDDDDDDDDVL